MKRNKKHKHGRQPGQPKAMSVGPRKATQNARAEGNGAGKFFYTNEQKMKLWNRLSRLIGAEYWIDVVIGEMERAKIAANVTQLRRKLERAGIYPPPVERIHNEHRECWCVSCAAKRSWPFYYVKNGQAYEHHLERREMDAEALDDPTLAEELKRLEGVAPGVVVKLLRRNGRAA